MSQELFHSLSRIITEKLTFQTLLDREPPIKTGFAKIDACMNGGITPGLIVLGAGPGVGKSTFCLQLAEQVSREENIPVLYFSLEMTRERVAAKAITLDNFRAQKASGAEDNTLSDADAAAKAFFTAAELFNPEDLRNMSGEKQAQYLQAQTRVAQNKNLHIVDSPLCAREIVEHVKSFMEKTLPAEEQSRPQKPLVIVDYLQILPPDPNSRPPATDKQQVDLNLKVLRELILKDIPVILISSLSRGNYSGGNTRSMKADAFKETGGIEYSADVLMGLQFSACHQKGGCNPDEEKGKYPREAEIIILKQRYGGADVKIPLRYYAQFDYMEEVTEQTPPAEQTSKKKTSEAVPAATPTPEQPAASAPQAKKKTSRKQSKKAPAEQPETQSDTPDNSTIVHMNNTKVAYRIRNGQWKPGKTAHCNVATQKDDSVITEFILQSASSDSDASTADPVVLTAYDCEVADAVYSLYRSDPSGFTLRQLLYILTGDKNQTLTNQKRAELEQSLRHLMNTAITITCTEEMVKMRKKPELLVDGAVVFSGRFANIKEDEKKKRYLFQKEADTAVMPLYSYGECTTQMIRIPLKLVAARAKNGDKVPDTKDNILIKHYLIRRLEVIRKGISNAPHLLQVNYFNQSAKDTSGLLALTGVRREKYSGADWTKKLTQTKETVKAILDIFQDYGYITGYELQELVGVTLPKEVNNPYSPPKKDGSHL